MCRGATLAPEVDASLIAPQPSVFLLASLGDAVAEAAYPSQPAPESDLQRAPLITERKLRAHSVSFLN
jgi:hypothetical protein